MFVKYGNAQVKNHPNGVCKNCGMPLQKDEVKLCEECLLIRSSAGKASKD